MKKLLHSSRLSAALIALFYAGTLWAAADDRKLEVFSWWTSGSEAKALRALFQIYRQRNPGVEILNAAITGGGGSAALPVLQTRLADGNPPDTWQTHPGAQLKGYVDAGNCSSVTDLYQLHGWDKVVPKVLVDQLTHGGERYAVLAGVHRGNLLWYNQAILQKAGIQVGNKLSFDQFLAAAEKLKAAGICPLAVGDSDLWVTTELFENTLLGVLGPQGWQDLFSGRLAFDDPKVKQAARLYGKMLDYQNPDHAALTWDQAVKMLIDGQAAFTAMGDWAYGELIHAGLKENQDFGWVCSPGTDGAFIVVSDAFTLAKGAVDLPEAEAWLETVGSKEAQETFNALKGSIPARTDVDLTHFGAYQHWSVACFTHDALLLSCVNGEAAPYAFQQALNDAVNSFVANRDVGQLTDTLVRAASASGLR